MYAVTPVVLPATETDLNNSWWFLDVSALYSELSDVSNLYVLPLAKPNLGFATPLI